MAGARRTTQVEGYVAFPVHSQEYRNTQEGGMFVKLVVVEQNDFDNELARCCGVTVTDMLTGSFAGDDSQAQPPELDFSKELTAEDVEADQTAWDAYVGHHYPLRNDESPAIEHHERCMSRPYRAAIVMGSTGWSGYNDASHRKWHATFDDLTDDGKALYQLVKKLNPGCTLHLLTFLDT
jgi:hypothetical protein